MLETAVVAARLAGQRAMEEINYIRTSVKGPDQLVTQADVVCQKIIIDRIKETFPDDGFIAEEGKGGGLFKQHPRGDSRIWWVIDPIDGTNNFAKGMLLFTVAIAAMSEGQPVVGATDAADHLVHVFLCLGFREAKDFLDTPIGEPVNVVFLDKGEPVAHGVVGNHGG